ncbi:MAG: hypothetical protein ABW174_15395 [Flavitalea sp.]
MEKFTASIQLQNADTSDYKILSRQLKDHSFHEVSENKQVLKLKDKPVTLKFFKLGSWQPIVTEVMSAARKTGRAFTFTVMKNKKAV